MTAPTATTFTLGSTGPYANAVWTLDTNQNTSTSRFYEKNGDTAGTKGIEISLVSGITRFYVNTGNNSTNPFYVSVNDPFAINNQDVAIVDTDTVYFADNYGTQLGTLTITSSLLWTQSGSGTLATITWTPSFVDQGNNYITATITGTPLSAFGTGFSAVNIGLIKDTNNVQTSVSTIVEFPDNTSVNSQYRTFFYTPGSTYFFANQNVWGIYGPAFQGIAAASTTTRKKVHSNFW